MFCTFECRPVYFPLVSLQREVLANFTADRGDVEALVSSSDSSSFSDTKPCWPFTSEHFHPKQQQYHTPTQAQGPATYSSQGLSRRIRGFYVLVKTVSLVSCVMYGLKNSDSDNEGCENVLKSEFSHPSFKAHCAHFYTHLTDALITSAYYCIKMLSICLFLVNPPVELHEPCSLFSMFPKIV